MSNAEVWPITEIPAGGRPGPTVIVYTASFAPTGDQALLLSGQPLVFNSASPLTFTLPNFPPSADWWVPFDNIGAGALTVARNGRSIDGVAADLIIQQNQGGIIYTDGSNYFTIRGVGGSSSGGLNGVSVKTADYNLAAGDNGKLIAMNSSSPHSLVVASPPPSATWAVFIQNVGSGLLTVDRNGLNIDTAASNLTLKQGEGLILFTDGSNYFTERGMSLVKSVAGRTGDVTLAVADVSGAVPSTRNINTTAPITGGGDLSADRTLDINDFGGDAGAGGIEGIVPAPGAGDAAAGKFLKADATWAAPPGTSLARTTASIDAGTLTPGASAVGTVAMCKGGFLYKVVAVAMSWLRLYKTAAGRDADLSRAYGVAPGDVGMLVEIAWLGAAPLTWEMQQDAILQNGDGSPTSNLYWSVFNREVGSMHQTYTLTFMAIET